MVEPVNTLLVVVPESFQFLNLGWWAVHIVAIAVVVFIGFKIGQSKKG